MSAEPFDELYLGRLATELGLREDAGGWWTGRCFACDADSLILTLTGYTCSSCGDGGIPHDLEGLLEARRNGSASKEEKPPPTLADVWASSLEGYLRPDPWLLRPSDVGMGADLDHLLGGGLTVGQTVALVSHGAGVGKTALVHQWADGIAEMSARSLAAEGAVCPVVMVTEMTTADMTIRSLARQAGVGGYLLRDPRGPHGSRPLGGGETVGEAALAAAASAAEAWSPAALHMTPIDRRTRVTLGDLSGIVRAVRGSWLRAGADVPAVVVVVDPLHRLLDPTRSEVEGIRPRPHGPPRSRTA